MEVRRIEANLNQVLAPSAADAVARFQRGVKSDFLRMESNANQQDAVEAQQAATQRLDALRDNGARKLPAGTNDGDGRHGLNAKQMETAHRTGKFTTTPRQHGGVVYRRIVDHFSGGEVDPKKFRAAFTDAMNNPFRARERFIDMFGPPGGDKADRRRWRDQLSTEMIGLELQKRRDNKTLAADKNAFKPGVHTLSDREQAGLDVSHALLKHATPESMDSLKDRVTNESRSSDGLRGDVARAFAVHESQPEISDMVEDLADTNAVAAGRGRPISVRSRLQGSDRAAESRSPHHDPRPGACRMTAA